MDSRSASSIDESDENLVDGDTLRWFFCDKSDDYLGMAPLPRDVIRLLDGITSAGERDDDLDDYLFGRISHDTFAQTGKALSLEPQNIWVWECRRQIIGHLRLDLKEELKFVESFIKDNGDCSQIWYHRQWIIVQLEDTYKISELEFAREIIHDDPNNFYVWHHVEKLAEMVGPSRMLLELDFAKDILKRNPKLNYVWAIRQSFVENLGIDASIARQEFDFSASILSDDANNKNAWYYRRWLVGKLGINESASAELEFTDKILSEDPKNSDAWYQRRWLSEKLGGSAVGDELSLTKKILSKDTKNDYAWYHRKWVFRELGQPELADELVFLDEICKDEIDNGFFWDQRFICVAGILGSYSTLFRSNVEKLEVKEDNVPRADFRHRIRAFDLVDNVPRADYRRRIRALELDYAFNAISNNPRNEYPWRYLRCLYSKSEFDCSKFEDVCETVLYDGTDELIDQNLGVILKSKQCVNALDTILEFISCGYQPSSRLSDVIDVLCSRANLIREAETTPISAFFEGICLFLQYVDPMRAGYWGWRTSMVRNEVYTFYEEGVCGD